MPSAPVHLIVVASARSPRLPIIWGLLRGWLLEKATGWLLRGGKRPSVYKWEPSEPTGPPPGALLPGLSWLRLQSRLQSQPQRGAPSIRMLTDAQESGHCLKSCLKCLWGTSHPHPVGTILKWLHSSFPGHPGLFMSPEPSEMSPCTLNRYLPWWTLARIL